jgi:hypothetical protein
MKQKSYTLLLSALMFSMSATAQSIAGITSGNELFTISNPAAPGTISTPVAITGIAAGQTIAGTDFRPATGELYALGYDASNGNAQLYTINISTAVATSVGAALVLDLGTGSIGFDFNPTVDRIRVTGANRKNYRLHPVTGAIAATDADLAYAATDVNSASLPSVGASAYTNSYIGAEATTLYNYDESLNVLTTQIPPNNGTQNTVGASGIMINAADRSTDMDIFYDTASQSNMAYFAANTTGSNDQLYTINLSTGAATLLGTIGSGIAVKDIAVTIDRTLPPVTGQMVYALTKTNNNFISFDSDRPSMIRSLTAITGVTAGQKIVGMDFRPADRQLYGLGYNFATTDYQLYLINTATGAATAVNATPGQIALGNTGNIGFDFNPAVDRIRVVSGNTAANYRLNPNDGSIAATDLALNYAAGDLNAGKTPYVGSVAYLNSYSGSTTTSLLGVDDSLATLLLINPPNNGALNTVLPSIMPLNPADLTIDMDFYYDSAATANTGFLAANTGSAVNDNLYTVTESGALTMIGSIGFGIPIADIAVRIDFTNAPPPLGISGVDNNRKKLALYPNPATEHLYIGSIGTYRKVRASITDISGRELRNVQVKNNRISLSGLAPGLYQVLVEADGEVCAPARFIKQ